ncbi:MAG: tetratricopeptide repeat protein, partial [Pontixanthobacter sp.]
MRKPYFDSGHARTAKWRIVLPMMLPLFLMISACSLFEGDPEGNAALATQLLSERRIAEARLAINDAIEARDDDPEFYLISAQIELTAGSNEGAFNAFQNAMALDPTNIAALLGVSQLGLQLGRLTDASSASERLLALNPRQTEALLVQGLIALLKRRNDEALALADRVLEFAPSDEAGTILKARIMFI